MGEEIKKRDFDQGAATWDENPNRTKLAKAVGNAIKAAVPLSPQFEVLDFGCGTGLVALELANFVKHVDGIDTSQGMLDVFASKIAHFNLSNVNVRKIELQDLLKTDKKWDLIVTSMTLHHIQDIPATFGIFRQLLKAGGKLCFADLDLDGGKFHEDNTGIMHFGFDRAEISKLLENAGFIHCRLATAHEIEKPSGKFTVFLGVAEKR